MATKRHTSEKMGAHNLYLFHTKEKNRTKGSLGGETPLKVKVEREKAFQRPFS